MQIVSFLDFGGKNIIYHYVNDVFWVAIKPVCEAFNLDYEEQHTILCEDKILKTKLSEHTIYLPGETQPRLFVCLPEEFYYSWLFSIQSDSKELQEYITECCRVLFKRLKCTERDIWLMDSN